MLAGGEMTYGLPQPFFDRLQDMTENESVLVLCRP